MNTTTHLVMEQLDATEPLGVALSLIADAGLGPEEVCGGEGPACPACENVGAAFLTRPEPAIGRAA